MTAGGSTFEVPYAAANGTTNFGATRPSVPTPAAPATVTPVSLDKTTCTTASPLTGQLALVDRITHPNCTVPQIALAVQGAGAVGLLITPATNGLAAAPSGTVTGLTIPAVGISRADRTRILAAAAPRSAQMLPAVTPANGARVGLDSRAWGHEGGNGITAQVINPGTNDAPLGVQVTGRAITVSAATDATGALTSTAAQVVSAIDASPEASALVDAYTYRGSAGDGVVSATPVVTLSDNLSAPRSVSRDPHAVYAIKIGKTRDGSKPGVLAYGQEHAREWVPPLVTLEVAERLLRNYSTHAPTRDLVDNLEIWIAPSINPDGGHYSFYDFASQRKNMVRHCAEGEEFDVGARNQWGVDLNRNFDEYSHFDGYAGGGDDCTGGTYSGPAELSEPEANNVDWLMARDNMKFSMNMHSSGNYFMWAPGAYVQAGRVTSPRPSVKEEAFFWAASERILTGIKRHRGLSVTPARTGPIVDVLYSAAGNSGDMAWYKYGIYGWSFEVGSTFQPPFRTTPDAPNAPNAHDEVMEYGNGLMELVRVARDLDMDVTPPETTLEVTETAGDPTKVNVRFVTNEPADVRYTVGGTRPTEASTLIDPGPLRTGGETVVVDKGSSIFFYATDPAGNVEAGYDPASATDTRYRKWKALPGWRPTTSAASVELAFAADSIPAGGSTGATVRVQTTNEFGLPASGVVTLSANGVSLGEFPVLDGVATGTVGPLGSAGSYTVSAVYSGDDLAAGASSTATLTVTAAPVVTPPVVTPPVVTPPVVTPPVAEPDVTAKVRVTVAQKRIVAKRTRATLTVRVTAPGARPTGRVSVTSGGKTVGSGTLRPNGTATVKLRPFAKAGKRKVTVTYSGSPGITGATKVITITVRR